MSRVKTILAVLILAILWLLTGCTNRIETQKVLVPVIEPCIEKKEVPEPASLKTKSLKVTDSDYTKIQAYVLDNKSLQASDEKLRALVKGCVKN